MLSTTRQFIDAMERKRIKYDNRGTSDSGKDVVHVTYTGDNMTSIKVRFHFNNDLEDVAVRVFDICNVQRGQLASAIVTVNALNNKYRFAKFVLDPEDSTVQAEMDLIFRSNDVGEICLEALSHMVNICDKAYPDLMKALYS